jgi:hypothetical protein
LTITGAEYRHALICYDAYGNYEQLDEAAQKRINKLIFGQSTEPTEAKKHNAGIDRWNQFGYIVLGEAHRRGKSAAEDKELAANKLTDAEINKLESTTKDFAAVLVDAGIWKKDSDEYELFMKHEAREVLPSIDPGDLLRELLGEKEKFGVGSVTGAEYRRALVLNALFTPLNYIRLDDKDQKRADKEVFGQEERPDKKTAEYQAGVEKLNHACKILRIQRNESFATASPEPEADAASRLVRDSEFLDGDMKNLYQELHDKRFLSRADEGLLADLLKDPKKSYEIKDKEGNVKSVPSHELAEDIIVLKAAIIDKD